MQVIEQEIIRRFPQWFNGPKGKISTAIMRSYGKFCRFDEIERFLANHGHLKGQLLVEQALEYLDIRYAVDQIEKSYIPASGRCIVVANHPAGVVDALALLHFIGSVRQDVRILANEALSSLGLLDELLIPVDVFTAGRRRSCMDAVHQALEGEQCVIIFPAGEVSRLRPSGIKDTPWHTGFVRLAAKHNAPIVPVRIKARNSALFYSLSAIYKPLGTLMLPREITARRGTRIEMRIGLAHRVNSDAPPKPSLSAIRQSLYAIGTRRHSRIAGPEPLISPVDPRLVKSELKRMELLGSTPDGKQIYSGRILSGSLLLSELGRLRELTFRSVGEGTGKRLDIDRYDTWYEHILLWSPDDLEIVGAYRIAFGDQVYADYGIDGFYSASLFKYSCETLSRLVKGAELGRSFVVPKYWNSRSLDNLWHGIGACLARRPEVQYLFGPVSISADMPIAARECLIAYYRQYHGCQKGSATACRPFQPLQEKTSPLSREEAFRSMREELSDMGVKIPTLYKQYMELCEPDGVRFLAFGVDPDFNNTIDGLMELEIGLMKPHKYARYFGRPDETSGKNAA
jgi:putative hemolysin